MDKIIWLALFLVIGLWACQKDEDPDDSTAKQPWRELTDHTLTIEEIDEQLGDIILEAHRTFPQFIRKLQHPAPGEEDFQVKYPFPADEGSGFRYEHLWLGDISFENGRYFGTVINQPYYVRGLKAGDRLPFWGDDITDWMYFKDGVIMGGRSIKYLIEQLPEADRDETTRTWRRRF